MPRPSAPAGPCIWRTWQSPNDARSSALIVASASATLGLAGLATYGAAKAGAAALVRSPPADLAGSLVTANAISPGATAGTMLAKSARLLVEPGPNASAPHRFVPGARNGVVRFDLYPCRHGVEDREVGALSGQDEDMGRTIVATLAWGAACEALGHADEAAQTHPSELSLARADAARAEVARTSDRLNEALAGIGLGPFLAGDEQ